VPRKPEYDRDVLIDRARDLFWKQGWAGTSMKDLELALGVKPGSFYSAFGSKNALFELALDRYAAEGAARLGAMVSQHGAFSTLKRYPTLVISAPGDTPRACMLAKTVLELSGREDTLAARANAHLARMEDSFGALFRQAQKEGAIAMSHDPDALARRYQSDLIGLRVSAERENVDAHAIAEEIANGLDRIA